MALGKYSRNEPFAQYEASSTSGWCIYDTNTLGAEAGGLEAQGEPEPRVLPFALFLFFKASGLPRVPAEAAWPSLRMKSIGLRARCALSANIIKFMAVLRVC